MDNLADADSLTIEKEENDDSASENGQQVDVAPADADASVQVAVVSSGHDNLSRAGSRTSHRRTSDSLTEASGLQAGYLHATYNIMTQRSQEEEEVSKSVSLQMNALTISLFTF